MILSQLAIPIGAVPINFTHVSIFMAAGLLGKKYGTISQVVFVLLGAFGVPVFTGFTGGIGVVIGPTGGFIVGYIACAFVTAFIAERLGTSVKALLLAMYAGWFATYLPGIVWFMLVTKTGLLAALLVCLVPFLLGDIIKTILSAVLVNRLHVIIKQSIGEAA